MQKEHAHTIYCLIVQNPQFWPACTYVEIDPVLIFPCVLCVAATYKNTVTTTPSNTVLYYFWYEVLCIVNIT